MFFFVVLMRNLRILIFFIIVLFFNFLNQYFNFTKAQISTLNFNLLFYNWSNNFLQLSTFSYWIWNQSSTFSLDIFFKFRTLGIWLWIWLRYRLWLRFRLWIRLRIWLWIWLRIWLRIWLMIIISW